MVTDIELLRAEAHKKVDKSDAQALAWFLRGDGKSAYGLDMLAALHEDAEAYKRGEGITYSEEEFWQRVKLATGYTRQSNAPL